MYVSLAAFMNSAFLVLIFFFLFLLTGFCTTIVPTLFVLIGFVVFKYASPQRNLSPITLDLAGYNSAVSTDPIFPLPFNSPSNPYVCQPGTCIYFTSIVEVPETDEMYPYCGGQVTVDEGWSCTIDESADILSTLNDFEDITTIETYVSDISTVSWS